MPGKKVMYFGHAGFQITSEEEKIIIIDPWPRDNPLATYRVEDIIMANAVLVLCTRKSFI